MLYGRFILSFSLSLSLSVYLQKMHWTKWSTRDRQMKINNVYLVSNLDKISWQQCRLCKSAISVLRSDAIHDTGNEKPALFWYIFRIQDSQKPQRKLKKSLVKLNKRITFEQLFLINNYSMHVQSVSI